MESHHFLGLSLEDPGTDDGFRFLVRLAANQLRRTEDVDIRRHAFQTRDSSVLLLQEKQRGRRPARMEKRSPLNEIQCRSWLDSTVLFSGIGADLSRRWHPSSLGMSSLREVM